MLLMVMVGLPTANAFVFTMDPYLEGIGYSEPEKNVALNSNFQSDKPSGVNWASFGGGTSIYIKGVGLDTDNPESHQIIFESQEFEGTELVGPKMTNDDGFNSNPVLGHIAYRTPALWDLFGME
jgi:hypothetical protein